MNARRSLPWVFVLVAAVAWALAIAIALPRVTDPLVLSDGLWGLSFLGLSVVGATVVSRHRGNGFGWALLLGSTGIALGVLASDYSTRIGEGTAGWPGGIWVFLVGEAVFMMAFACLFAAFHRFPDGNVLEGRGWRVADGLIRALVIGNGLAVLLDRTPGIRAESWPDPEIFWPNPLTRFVPLPELDAVGGAVSLCVLLLGLVGFASLAVRYRRGTQTVRAQLRWVLLPVVTGPIVLGLLFLYDALVTGPLPGLVEVLGTMVFTLGIPAGIFMAITKTGLYEIDRIIRRTAAYTIVTTILLGVYAAAVLALGRMAVWAGAPANDLVVALSTLIAAAVARPLLARVRQTVDRRFNRAGRDAERIVSEFRTGLRDDVSGASVRQGLLRAVNDSLEPEFVRIWMPDSRSIPTASP